MNWELIEQIGDVKIYNCDNYYKLISDSKIEFQEYIDNDIFHHRDPNQGPTVITFYPGTNQVRIEYYYFKGEIFRNINDGPAITMYDINSNIIYELYKDNRNEFVMRY